MHLRSAIDDPHKVVKVVASAGKSGDEKEISYTNCKVIGNGSFGIVFQAKLVVEEGSNEDTDIAIKKVLQDKRFKVRCNCPIWLDLKGLIIVAHPSPYCAVVAGDRIASCRLCDLWDTPTWWI